ncbi:MAG: NAD(P)-dependent oxidoreductase [Planctomycetota bacterium]|nr:NAD(P)-dependent oxidoreductase [Planctomycetota bacterium]
MAKKRMKVGFVGLGLMGAPMAMNVLKAGWPLRVWNRTADKAEPLVAAGAVRAATATDAARGADFVIVMVADDTALDSVLFGENGLSRGLKRGAILINCSTTSPAISFRAATALRSISVRYLEAPVMRSVQAARDGKLQMLVGGSREDFQKAEAVLKSVASDIHHIGDIGKASTLKLALSLVAATMIQAFAEYFVLARKTGIPFETMMDVLKVGPLDSQQFRYAEQMVVNPGARPSFYLKHMLKDMNLAMDLARQMDVPMPLTSEVRQMLAAAKNLDRGDEDFAALLDLMAGWAGVPMRG